MLRTLLISALLFGLSTQALAQTCAPAEQLLATLAGRYQERVVFLGQNTAGNPVIVTLSDTGTWTLLVVRYSVTTEATACIISSGRNGVLVRGRPV